MPRDDLSSLWNAASAVGNLHARFISEDDMSVTLGDLVSGSILGGRGEELRGRSVLLATTNQLATALALIELDGLARRLVLCPPDFPSEHIPFVIRSARVDAIVSDRTALEGDEIPGPLIRCIPQIEPANCRRSTERKTQWVLLTSGTTGRPKMVAHTLSSLSGAIKAGITPPSPVVWCTFYDIRRFGGLQIFLRALLGMGSLVLSSVHTAPPDLLIRAGDCKATHFTGTPSHWRRVLMSPSARRIEPQYIRLSGEIADQSILDHLRSFYPMAVVAHAFASTEAGVAFEVRDGLAGFPASLVGRHSAEVGMKVVDGSLRIRSTRTASRYLGQAGKTLTDADGFVDTGDMLDLQHGRYYFIGRRDGVINVGGFKVHPEEVEAVINGHPLVRMSLVRTRKNPIMGALVVADVVLKTETDPASERAAGLEDDILQLCRKALPRYKVPAAIYFVRVPPLGATGKTVRCCA